MLTVEEIDDFNLALHKYYDNVLSESFRKHSSKIVIAVEPIEFGFRLILKSDVISGGMLFNDSPPDMPRPKLLSELWGHLTEALDGADVLLSDMSYSGHPGGYSIGDLSRMIFRDMVFHKQKGPKSLPIAAAVTLMTNLNSSLLTVAEYEAGTNMYHIEYNDGDYYIADDDIGLATTPSSFETLEDKVSYWINFTVVMSKSYSTVDRYSGGFLSGDTSPLKQLLRDIYKKETDTMIQMYDYVHPKFTLTSFGEVLH